MDYVLRTNALCKKYKDFKALNGLSMNVPKGAIYGFVGKNGAGKTTVAGAYIWRVYAIWQEKYR